MKRLKLMLAALIISAGTFAQTGIGTTSPETSAQLDVSSTTKGFLAPRMTAEQRISISSPATGLMVYQTDNDPGYYYFNGTYWSKSSLWSFDGETDIYYNGGNVGIGTTSPAGKLQISSSSTGIDGKVIISSPSSNHCQLQIGNPGGDEASISFLPNVTSFGTTPVSSGGTSDIWAIGPGIWAIGSTTFGIGSDAYNTNGGSILNITSDGNVGIGTTTPGYTLTVAGTAWVTSGSWSGSDSRWKTNVTPLTGSLDKVMKLEGVNFDWKRDEYPEMNFEDRTQIGFIAQEVEKIIPELVTTNKDGYKGLDYAKLTPVLVKAIQEQQKEIETLKAQNADAIDQLKAEVENLKKMIGSGEIQLSNNQ